MTASVPLLPPVAPFCGLPFSPLDSMPRATVAAIVGAGHSLGAAHPGAENGPYFLRTLTKAHTWSANAPTVVDLRTGRTILDGVADAGDIDFTGMTLEEALGAVRDTVARLPPAAVPCLIGGDHTVTVAAVDALRERRSDPFWVVHFDHHPDLQTWGDAGASPAAERESVFNTNVMSHVADRLGAEKLIQVGLSPYLTVETSSAPATVEFLRSLGGQVCLSSPEIEDPAAFLEIVGRDRDVYVSVDVDVLENEAMSSTAYPAEVGLRLRELLQLLDLVLRHNRLIGCDVVEFSAPREARDPRTLADAARAVTILLHLLTALRGQREPSSRGVS